MSFVVPIGSPTFVWFYCACVVFFYFLFFFFVDSTTCWGIEVSFSVLLIILILLIIHKIFEKDSCFHVKYRTTGKVQFLFFKRFLSVMTKFSFPEEEWALGKNSLTFWDFPDISLFPKILSRLSRSLTLEATSIYQKHFLNHRRGSKYY